MKALILAALLILTACGGAKSSSNGASTESTPEVSACADFPYEDLETTDGETFGQNCTFNHNNVDLEALCGRSSRYEYDANSEKITVISRDLGPNAAANSCSAAAQEKSREYCIEEVDAETIELVDCL